MEHLNDWDLQAVVRSCATFSSHPHPHPHPHTQHPDQDPASLYALEYLDLDHKPKPLLPPSQSQSQSQSWPAGDDRREMMISFPAAAAASTSSALRPGRKPGIRNSTPRPRPKTSKKSQLKKVVCEVPVADGGVSSDLWAWRKYGQKPIKGSPYPRGYYKCSSLKGCMARKLVERSPAKPGVLVITYMAEHCHPVPTQINALAGTTRHKSTPADDHATTSPKSHGKADGDIHSNETSSMAVDGTTEEIEADDDWPTGLDLDEFLAPVGDVFHEDVALERRLSL